MPKIALAFPDKLKKRMASHSEIRWPNALRALIEKKLEDFDRAEFVTGASHLCYYGMEKRQGLQGAKKGRGEDYKRIARRTRNGLTFF